MSISLKRYLVVFNTCQNQLVRFDVFLSSNRILLSIPKASILESALNLHNTVQLTSLLSDLRQQALHHLLFRNEGTWKERKRIDRYGNYVSVDERFNKRSMLKGSLSNKATTKLCDLHVRFVELPMKYIAIY